MTQQFETQKVIFSYKSLKVDKSQLLGQGAYGAVYKAKCDQLPCAAEVLHPTILETRDPGARKRFEKECTLLESIRHPHIVQYLGMTRDPESRLPVLLMELLDESLTKMLQCSQQSLAFHVQVGICHDITLAVAYLHLKEIIHRDLSSNSVLIIAGRRAKVTDFCTSKLAVADSTTTPLTTRPGTLAYMPPEALREPPRYTKKMDCFSEGVIMIQVCSTMLPEPGPRSQLVQDFRSPTGTIEMPVLEPERRKNHIDLINPTHALLPIAKDCLHYQENDRPSSEELCQRLADLRGSSNYIESLSPEQFENVQYDGEVLKFKDEIRELKVKEAANIQLIHQQRDEIRMKDIQLQEKEKLLQQKESQFQQEMASRERQLQMLNRKLKEQRKSITETQKIIPSLQRRAEHERLGRQKQQNPQPPPPTPPPVRHPAQILGRQLPEEEHVYTSLIDSQTPPQQQTGPHGQARRKSHPPHPPTTKEKIALNWRDGGRAPYMMERGDAVGSGNMAYFLSIRGEACSYNVITKKWNEIPKCPYGYSSLAVIYGHLTAIGGCTFDNFDPQDKLVSRMGDRGWVEHFPPMPTKRWKTAAVTTKQYLVVVGGKKETSSQLNIVEVMEIHNLEWSTVASLPHPYSEASATICGDYLYLLGGFDQNGKSKSVLTCSLTELLKFNTRYASVWRRVADVPTTRSTCAAVNGQLLAVGGLDAGNRKTDAIYVYVSTTDSWDLISNMPTAQYDRLVAVLPTNEMIVVGGCTRFKTDKVDIAKAM